MAIAVTLATRPADAGMNLWVPPIRTLQSRPASKPSWDDASRQVSSPKDACKAVKSRVKYSQDMQREDEWRSGKDTWDRGKGDCEDYAAAVNDLCKEKGFKAEVYVLQPGTTDKAHAVTMGEMDGTLWVSSNGSYEEVKSLHDAKEKIARDLGWWAPDVDVHRVDRSSLAKRESRYVDTATDTRR